MPTTQRGMHDYNTIWAIASHISDIYIYIYIPEFSLRDASKISKSALARNGLLPSFQFQNGFGQGYY